MEYNLLGYDKYIVSFSGGKDSTATFLYLLENKIPINKIELWHQDIDGNGDTFFDWEITADYCRKFAKAFGVNLFFQWKEGGFKREMLRQNSRTAPTHFQLEDGTIGIVGGDKGKLSTRRKFPQQSPDLSVRWCSSYLKIDVCSTAIRNQKRFKGIRTLVLSGERGEESPQRAKYAIWETDKSDLRDGKKYKRYVDRHRPIRDWKETEVWSILEKYRVRVHPCYYMGWGRCSCKFCIFGNKNQFASVAYISPQQFYAVAEYEKQFGCTINRKCDLLKLISTGNIYPNITEELKSLATGYDYNKPIIISDNEPWLLPAGAFGDNCGSM